MKQSSRASGKSSKYSNPWNIKGRKKKKMKGNKFATKGGGWKLK
jgi:hypothetical protein